MKERRTELAKRVDLTEALGKMPPQALDIEEAVIGAILLEKKAIDLVVDLINPDTFYSDAHREIYIAILDLFKANAPIDIRTVKNQLQKNGKLEMIGGSYAIAELSSKMSSSSNIEYHARILVEKAIRRDLIRAASDIHQKAYDDVEDTLNTLSEAHKILDGIDGSYFKGRIQSTFQLVDEMVKEIVTKTQQKGITGIPSGLQRLDRALGGFQLGELIIVAARPGMGKTAFIGAIAKNLAVTFNIPVGLFELEMTNKQIINRMLASEAELDITNIIRGKLSHEELYKYGDAAGVIKKSPIYIDDTAGISIMDLRARARRMVSEFGVKIIIVDYLQLMRGDRSSNNREQEISSITRGLKSIAKEMNIPVIALSQLSRSVESRGGSKIPQLSDLRESGSIEQDADIVLFLYRAEYYHLRSDDAGNSTQNVMSVIIAKFRNGPLDTVAVKFVGKYMTVKDWGDSQQPTFEEKLQSNIEFEEKKGPELGPDDMPF